MALPVHQALLMPLWVAQVFTQEYGVTDTETIYVHPGTGLLPKEYVDELAAFSRRVDVVVSGLGN